MLALCSGDSPTQSLLGVPNCSLFLDFFPALTLGVGVKINYEKGKGESLKKKNGDK